MKQRLLKAITALTLSAAIMLPADTLSASAHAAEMCAEEHVCNIDGYHAHDEYGYGIDSSVDTKYFEPEQYAAGTVAAPKASRKSGTITCSGNSASIKLTADSGATIYYSLNNSSFKKYSSAIKLTKNSTIIAYAAKNGKESSLATYTYKLKPKVSFSASDSGSAKTVKLSSGTDGVKLYYTTDGSKPTTKSKLYTSSGITLTKSCQLRVLAVKSGWANAGFSKNYTVNSSSDPISSLPYTKQLGEGNFLTPSASGNANIRYDGKSMATKAEYWSYSDRDTVWVSVSDELSVAFNIMQDRKFNTGDTIKSWKTGTGATAYAVLFGLKPNSDYIDIFTSSEESSKFFDKAELKAISIDYTGKNPSVLYFYILAHDEKGNKTCIEGITKVVINNSNNIALRGSGNSGNTGSSSSGTGNNGGSGGSSGASTNSTDKIITKGSETRDCKACTKSLCWDCDGTGKEYDYISGVNFTCSTCNGTGKCKVCNGARKITVEVNVINENAIPEGKIFKKCTNCFGSGVCPYCNGGKVYVYADCFHCKHTGICGFCNGSGGTLTDKPEPNTGSGSSGSSSGDTGGGTSGGLDLCFTCGGTGNCSYCHGLRSCPVCFGKGGMSVPTYGTGGSGWVNCAGCNGSKKCSRCGGSGKCQTCGGNR